MDATSLPQQCLQLIFEGMELEELVAVGGVCSAWRAASLATRYDLSLPWTYLQAFSDLVRPVGLCSAQQDPLPLRRVCLGRRSWSATAGLPG